MTHADDNHKRYQDLRQRYQGMETHALKLLWEKDARQDWAKALLKSELIARGFSQTTLEATRAQIKSNSGVSAPIKRNNPAHNATDKTDKTLRLTASAVAFIVVFGIQLHFAYQFVPAIPMGKQFDDFMLISMGMAFLPLILILIVAMAVVMLMGFIAFLFSRACWKLLGAGR